MLKVVVSIVSITVFYVQPSPTKIFVTVFEISLSGYGPDLLVALRSSLAITEKCKLLLLNLKSNQKFDLSNVINITRKISDTAMISTQAFV